MSTEHLIVGGGIYGTGVARELATRGEDVTLLEPFAIDRFTAASTIANATAYDRSD